MSFEEYGVSLGMTSSKWTSNGGQTNVRQTSNEKARCRATIRQKFDEHQTKVCGQQRTLSNVARKLTNVGRQKSDIGQMSYLDNNGNVAMMVILQHYNSQPCTRTMAALWHYSSQCCAVMLQLATLRYNARHCDIATMVTLWCCNYGDVAALQRWRCYSSWCCNTTKRQIFFFFFLPHICLLSPQRLPSLLFSLQEHSKEKEKDKRHAQWRV